MFRTRKTFLLLFLGVTLAIATGACSCQSVLTGLVGSPTAAATPIIPTPEAQIVPATPSADAFVLPEGTDQPFKLELTEADINEQITNEAFSQEGLEITNARVTLVQDQVLVNLYANHSESGLAGEVTLRGRPVVVDGQVYVQVDQVTLGPTFTGFVRILAEGMIKEALKQYDEGHGIPVPTEDMVVESVQVVPGKMIITGKTK